MLNKKNILKRYYFYKFVYNKREMKRYKDSYIKFDLFHLQNDENINSYEWRWGFVLAMINFHYFSLFDYITIF